MWYLEIVLLATCGNGRFYSSIVRICHRQQDRMWLSWSSILPTVWSLFLYTHYSACDVLNETRRFCGLRGHPFSHMSTSTCEGHSLLQSDNTPDELYRLIEAAAVSVRLMLWNFQPPGNYWWRRDHLCIQTDGQHFQQLLLTIYELHEPVVMTCVKISKYVRFYIRTCKCILMLLILPFLSNQAVVPKSLGL